jgi:hypothetical protein
MGGLLRKAPRDPVFESLLDLSSGYIYRGRKGAHPSIVHSDTPNYVALTIPGGQPMAPGLNEVFAELKRRYVGHVRADLEKGEHPSLV